MFRVSFYIYIVELEGTTQSISFLILCLAAVVRFFRVALEIQARGAKS